MRRAVALYLPSLALCAPPLDASTLPVDAVAFQIAESSASSVSLRAIDDGSVGFASCTFSWDTRGASSAADSSATTASTIAANALLATLSGKCAASVPGSPLVYRVCFGAGGVATQSSGSGGDAWTFSLGKLATGGGLGGSETPSDVTFSGGDKCGTIERAARAVLHCGETAAVVAANEPTQCEYSIDVTFPELCAMESVFPRPSERRQAETSAARAGPRSANEDYVRALPAGLRTKLEGQLGDARGETGAREIAESPATVLDENDVQGTGGASIGVDDLERHGGGWQGLDASARAAGPQAWTVEVHHADVDAAASSAATPRAWRCAAWSVDDLRRGTEGGGSASTGSSSDPASASLTIWAPTTVSPSTPLRVTGAVARGINRERLAVHARVADDGASAVVSWAREAPALDASAGDEPLRIAFLSVAIEM